MKISLTQIACIEHSIHYYYYYIYADFFSVNSNSSIWYGKKLEVIWSRVVIGSHLEIHITWNAVIWHTRTQHIVPEWKIVSIVNFNQFFLWLLHLSRDWKPWNPIFFARELVCSLLLATWEKEYISAFVWLLLLPYDDENNYVIGQ